MRPVTGRRLRITIVFVVAALVAVIAGSAVALADADYSPESSDTDVGTECVLRTTTTLCDGTTTTEAEATTTTQAEATTTTQAEATTTTQAEATTTTAVGDITSTTVAEATTTTLVISGTTTTLEGATTTVVAEATSTTEQGSDTTAYGWIDTPDDIQTGMGGTAGGHGALIVLILASTMLVSVLVASALGIRAGVL